MSIAEKADEPQDEVQCCERPISRSCWPIWMRIDFYEC